MMEQFIDLILHLDNHLMQLAALHRYEVYGLLFLVIFCETGLIITPFLPGDSLLFFAGSLTAKYTHSLNITSLMGILILASFLGNQMNYTLGRMLGFRIFNRPNSTLFNKNYLKHAHDFYKRYGGKALILARFIPIVRTFAPFVAGIGNMKQSHFVLYNLLGACLWIGAMTSCGYWFGQLPMVQQHFSLVMYGIIILTILPMLFKLWRWDKSVDN
ncbi:MAG: hypothetical protein CMF38_02160 [Legionellaceae bacterium]|nr:hypothetical protein [Legionellaceae bacterium]HCA89131.1 DedA family protein [Legionellales bacterium]|tara:strand:+ start:1896 stop:2540 length:645 start_codon:yes stop_codon:yes gene_type:complete